MESQILVGILSVMYKSIDFYKPKNYNNKCSIEEFLEN